MGWLALHGSITASALADIGRWSLGRRVRVFALVAETGQVGPSGPDHRDPSHHAVQCRASHAIPACCDSRSSG